MLGRAGGVVRVVHSVVVLVFFCFVSVVVVVWGGGKIEGRRPAVGVSFVVLSFIRK